MSIRGIRLFPLLLIALPGAGCGGGPPPASPTQNLVLAVQKAYGGADRWRQHAGVRFAYEVRFSKEFPRLVFPEVAFRLDDYRYLWVTPPGSEESIRLRLDSEWGSVVRGLRAAGLRVEGQGIERERTLSLLEFSLRSIRYLFHLPLATSTGRWGFNSLIAPSDFDIDFEPVLEALPREPRAPLGPCVLVLDRSTHRVSRMLYVPLHSPPGPRGVEVTFEGHDTVDGIVVAVGRCHAEVPEEQRGFRRPDPFGLEIPPEDPEAAVLIREQVTGVQFLGEEAVISQYARPEDVDPESRAADGATPEATYPLQ